MINVLGGVPPVIFAILELCLCCHYTLKLVSFYHLLFIYVMYFLYVLCFFNTECMYET